MSKNVHKIITTIALIIGLVAGIFAIDSRYASVSALEQIEQQTVQSLESFRKSLDARYLYTRYNELIDQKMRLKIMQVSRPDDAEIKELLNQVNNNIKNTKTGIDKLNNE